MFLAFIFTFFQTADSGYCKWDTEVKLRERKQRQQDELLRRSKNYYSEQNCHYVLDTSMGDKGKKHHNKEHSRSENKIFYN